MYKIIKIKYKSVIVTDGQKESVTIQANGSLHEKGEQTFVYFENEDHIPFEIIIDQKREHLSLKQGKSVLRLKKGMRIDNDYETMYGSIPLTSELLKLEKGEEILKMKYHLRQNEQIISTVYMQLQWLNLE